MKSVAAYGFAGWSLACAAILALGVSGCTVSKRSGERAASPAQSAIAPYWITAAVRSRVYPSTRFVREDGEAVLEARIELMDEMGDSVKGVGTWHFELYAGDHRREGTVAQRLYAWDVPMMLLDEQRLYYDRITRAYLFRLKLDNIAPARRTTTFYATLVTPDGTRIESQQLFRAEDGQR